jgi:hypothetical protein
MAANGVDGINAPLIFEVFGDRMLILPCYPPPNWISSRNPQVPKHSCAS